MIPYIELDADGASLLLTPVCLKCQARYKQMMKDDVKLETWPELVKAAVDKHKKKLAQAMK